MSKSHAESHPLVEDASEEEEECRVCRGEAEEDRPLCKPCKCAGSIAFVHQDCLQSWLAVQRSDGKCELCKTDFRFEPKYDANAPAQLSTQQIVLALYRKSLYQWMPLLLRVLLAVMVWLVVAPLATSYAYQAWMRRQNLFFMSTRFAYMLVARDIVSGLIIMGSIILSFLSIMSFADFLRIEWGNGQAPRPFPPAPPRPPPEHNDIDHELYDQLVREPQKTDDSEHDFDEEDDEAGDAEWNDIAPENDGTDEDEERARHNEELRQQMGLPPDADMNDLPPGDIIGAMQAGPPPMDFEEDPVELNLALDELLGFRGPYIHVIRNLLWLVAFNAVYLGFFIFAPRILGSIVCGTYRASAVAATTNHTLSNQTNTRMNETIAQTNSTFGAWEILRSIEQTSAALNSTFRLSDLAVVVVGYVVVALSVLVMYVFWTLIKKTSFFRGRRNDQRRGLRDHLADVNRLLNMAEGDPGQQDVPQFGDDIAAIRAFGDIAMEFLLAVVKVGVLLSLKMFLLPVVLGVCIHAITATLVGSSIERVVGFAGADVFSFMLLHWVCGITFMLVVTVSVLQLREVLHPEILSQNIRPQEPQPDLLGNLMNETIVTHLKRLCLSLMIYAVLLGLQIYCPIQFMSLTGLMDRAAFLKFRFSFWIMPQLQIPVELLTFHLCMLAVLERNKNSIGELQYSFYKALSGYLNVTDCLVPKKVYGFRMVGSIKCVDGAECDNRLLELAAKEGKEQVDTLEDMLQNSETELVDPPVLLGTTHRRTGERVLAAQRDFIALAKPASWLGGMRTHQRVLLATRIGRYRLQRKDTSIISIYEEVRGAFVPRPPEGWDDLGAGGADVQGRWAYQKERKSRIEESLAERDVFFPRNCSRGHFLLSSFKIATIIAASWLTASVCFFCLLFGPILIGRFLYSVFSFPEKWVHDPHCFALGALIFFPFLSRVVALAGVRRQFRRQPRWLSRFRLPPFGKGTALVKAGVIAFGVVPVLIGAVYEFVFVLTSAQLGDVRSLSRHFYDSIEAQWLTGMVLLLLASRLCVAGVFTTRFWSAAWERVEARNAANDRQNANDELNAMRNEHGALRLNWQGRYGRVARFFYCWRAAVSFEYDKVDVDVLIFDSSLPVLEGVMYVLLCGIVGLTVGSYLGSQLPMVATSTLPAYCCRAGIWVSLAAILRREWSDQVSRWLEATHKVAFDDLFLIGEQLMDYTGDPPGQQFE